MSPDSVTAASVRTAVSMSVSPDAPEPIPLPARSATPSATIFGASPVKLSRIAPLLSLG